MSINLFNLFDLFWIDPWSFNHGEYNLPPSILQFTIIATNLSQSDWLLCRCWLKSLDNGAHINLTYNAFSARALKNIFDIDIVTKKQIEMVFIMVCTHEVHPSECL